MLQLQIVRNQGLGRCSLDRSQGLERCTLYRSQGLGRYSLDRHACCTAWGPQIPRAHAKLGMVAHICKPEARHWVGTGKPQALGWGLPESLETLITHCTLCIPVSLSSDGGILRLSVPSTFYFRKADLRSERHVRAGVRQHSMLNHRHLQPLRKELSEPWKSLSLLLPLALS